MAHVEGSGTGVKLSSRSLPDSLTVKDPELKAPLPKVLVSTVNPVGSKFDIPDVEMSVHELANVLLNVGVPCCLVPGSTAISWMTKGLPDVEVCVNVPAELMRLKSVPTEPNWLSIENCRMPPPPNSREALAPRVRVPGIGFGTPLLNRPEDPPPPAMMDPFWNV